MENHIFIKSNTAIFINKNCGVLNPLSSSFCFHQRLETKIFTSLIFRKLLLVLLSQVDTDTHIGCFGLLLHSDKYSLRYYYRSYCPHYISDLRYVSPYAKSATLFIAPVGFGTSCLQSYVAIIVFATCLSLSSQSRYCCLHRLTLFMSSLNIRNLSR